MRFRGAKVLLNVVGLGAFWCYGLLHSGSLQTDPELARVFLAVAIVMTAGAILESVGFELAEAWLQTIDPGLVPLSFVEALRPRCWKPLLERYRAERSARSLPPTAIRARWLGRGLFVAAAIGGIVYVISADARSARR